MNIKNALVADADVLDLDQTWGEWKVKLSHALAAVSDDNVCELALGRLRNGVKRQKVITSFDQKIKPAAPAVTPDVPVQDAVPDTAPADAAVTPAAAQNVVQDAKPEAAAVSAAALPQTGANWLAVVGSALSGLFLLAAGFVLDRKGRRMN